MEKKERALTPAEQKRKADFERLCQQMAQSGYQKRDLTVSVLYANAMSAPVMLPFAMAAFVVYRVFRPAGSGSFSVSLPRLALFWAAILLLLVLHELIHGAVWGLFAKEHGRAISFGFIWRLLTPYCTCAEPLKRWQYVLGTAMPTLILGFGLGAAAVGLGQPMLFLLSVIMLFGGGGDALIILKVLFHRSGGRNAVYCDHPYDCGVVVFEQSSNIADKGA